MKRASFGVEAINLVFPVVWRLGRSLFSQRIRRLAAKSFLKIAPRSVTSALIPRLTSVQLNTAVGNFEGRERTDWIQKEAYAIARRLLGLWGVPVGALNHVPELAFESSYMHVAFIARLKDTYRFRIDEQLCQWLDEFFEQNPTECIYSYRWGLRRQSAIRREAVQLDCQMSAGQRRARTWFKDGPLEKLEAHIAGARAGRGRPAGVFAFGDDRFGYVRRVFEPIAERLHGEGYDVIWLDLENAGEGNLFGVEDTAWGVRIRCSLPNPDEIRRYDAGAGERYVELKGHHEGLLSRDPALRSIARAIRPRIPRLLYEYLAAEVVARVVCAGVEPSFLLVQPDKGIAQRAFLIEAHRRQVPSFYYYATTEFGPSSYRPMADWVLVTNEFKVNDLETIGYDRGRLVAVGHVETDLVLTRLGKLDTRVPIKHGLSVLLLTKRSARVGFNFGRVRWLIELLSDLCPDWELVIKPHPVDGLRYEDLEGDYPGRLRVVRDKLVDLILSADLVVSGFSNAALHAVAVGKPVVVFDLEPKIDNGARHVFERSDYPSIFGYARTLDHLEKEVRRVYIEMRRRDGRDISLPELFVRDVFYSLDGQSAARIASLVHERAVKPRPMTAAAGGLVGVGDSRQES